MTPAGARGAAVGSMLVVGSLAAVRDVEQGRTLPRITIFVGALFAAALLAAIADGAPDLAGSLALLVLLSALITYGPDTIGAVTAAIG